MAYENDIYKVLVTKGNLAPAAAGDRYEDLTPGQIGVFNAETGLAVDGTVPTKNIVLAVGVDNDLDGVTDDIITSSGENIETSKVSDFTFRPHTAAQPMIVDVAGFDAVCETDYAIKVEFRNDQIYRSQGYNQFTKTYAVKSDCCKNCETCAKGDANILAKDIINTINLDVDGLLVAEAWNPVADAAIPNVDTFIATNSAVNTDEDETNNVIMSIRLTSKPIAINNYCSVNLKYFNQRQTWIGVSLVSGFDCTGTVTTVQDPAYSEGEGYDIKQKEYNARGYSGSPYAETNYGGFETNFIYRAEVGVNYDQIALHHRVEGASGWGEYTNNLLSEVAIPAADPLTRNGLIAILDNLLTPKGFEALSDDSAAAVADETVVEKTEDKGEDLDGLA